MKFPTPEDPARAPVWENYVVAQAAQAALGRIPRGTLAFGVRQEGADVFVHFQLKSVNARALEDMDDIVSELEALVGDAVRVARTYEVRPERSVSPHDGIRWIYLKRRRLWP